MAKRACHDGAPRIAAAVLLQHLIGAIPGLFILVVLPSLGHGTLQEAGLLVSNVREKRGLRVVPRFRLDGPEGAAS